MHNQAFSKIGIIVILIVLIGGGILAWQYFWVPKEEMRAPEEVVKDETADWKTYRNKEYRFEIKYPEELEARWFVYDVGKDVTEATGSYVMGDEITFYFYKKGEASPPGWGVGGYLFTGYLSPVDYQGLEWLGPSNKESIILDTPFHLSSTTLTVAKPVQSISCGIHQTAKFSVGGYYNKKDYTFKLWLYLEDFALLTEGWQEAWKTECPKIFRENIQKLEPKIKQFDLVVKSLKFLENYK